MIFFLLPLFCLAQECVVRGIDYSSLTKQNGEFYRIEYPKFQFDFNICGPVNDEGVIAIAYTAEYPDGFSLGKYSTQTPISDNFGNGFAYTEGDKGKLENPWRCNIYIECDETRETDHIQVSQSNMDEGFIGFKIQGPGCCISPEAENESKESNSTIIAICVICVVIVVAILAVFVIWLVINISNGKTGLAAIPIVGLFVDQPKPTPVDEAEQSNLIN